LFGYAAPFSFAYVRIGAAAGALVLFGVVQLTMIGYGIVRGERPSVWSWLGLALATSGLLVLTVPSATRPDPLGVVLMVVAGVAWAVYSLVGRGSDDPVAANAWSFLLASVPAFLLATVVHNTAEPTFRGAVLAATSGGVTSALGYAIWYRALPRLTVTQAAVAQLSVPIIAAVGAALLLGERLSGRLLFAGLLVLGGVSLVLSARRA
jgi:drug/metabolite transporter (DMT)-like permease